MSRENVQILRAAFDAYNRGDWEAALNDASPEFELDMSRSIGPQRGIYGLEQVRGFWNEWGGTFGSVRLDAEEFVEAGEHVVVPSAMHVRGRQGVEATARSAWVCTLRDGAVIRATMYQTKQDALESLGLSE